MKPIQKQPATSKQKNNQDFLNKFKSKHSVISKEGLLKLFQNKKKSIQIKIKDVKTNKEQIRQIAKRPEKENQKNHQIIKVESLRNRSEDSGAKSAQLYKPSIKLPSIHKSVSTTLKLSKRQATPTPSFQIQADSLPRIMKKSPIQVSPSKKPPRYNFQMDKFAIDHLDFMEKFEQRLRKREIISH